MNPRQARDLFPIVRKRIFMNHAGIAPMSDRVRAALSGLTEELTRQPASFELAGEVSIHLRRSLGRLLGAPLETIAIVPGGIASCTLLADGLDWRPGDNAVVQGEHPAGLGSPRSLVDRGVEVRHPEPEEGRPRPDAVLSLVDDSTRLVALDHVQLANGCRADLEAIGRECDRRGVIFAVDVTQSAGALRLDLSKLPVDFLAGAGHTWLMGAIGIGFCYCRPELLKRLGPEALRRFQGSFDPPGEGGGGCGSQGVSPLDAVAMAIATDLLLEVGPDVIEERVLSLSGLLAEGLAARGYELAFPSPRSDQERSGIVAFRRPGSGIHQVMRDLHVAGIVGQIHGDLALLSPHFYNTEQEVTRVLDVLAPQGAVLK
jgi:cysteine desulfurase / selenocysteine lyase